MFFSHCAFLSEPCWRLSTFISNFPLWMEALSQRLCQGGASKGLCIWLGWEKRVPAWRREGGAAAGQVLPVLCSPGCASGTSWPKEVQIPPKALPNCPEERGFLPDPTWRGSKPRELSDSAICQSSNPNFREFRETSWMLVERLEGTPGCSGRILSFPLLCFAFQLFQNLPLLG